MSAKARILVTSAAGRTGTPAVLELLNRGHPVRAFVRRDDHRAEVLRRAGAEIFVGDLLDHRDLRQALMGIQRAYHIPPFAPHLLNGSMLFALAAEEARLEVVALLSGWNPHPSHPSLATREHWIANNLYRWMPTVDVIHVNPGVFAFLYLLGLPAIVHLGLLALPFGDGLNAPPSNEDIGRVAAGVLADPASHVGRSYRPTGPELISAETVAEILSTQLGRRVRYQDVSFKMFTKAARASGFPIFDISQIRYYAEEIREGAFAMGAPTEHVLEVTGRAPESFSEIARRYLAQPSLIHPLVSAGTKPGALLFAFRMLLTPAWDVEAWERDRGFATISRPELAHENEAWRSAAARHSLLLEEPVR